MKAHIRMSLGKRVCGCVATLLSNNIVEVDLCAKHTERALSREV